ncbi:MAG: TonB-dependent receptor plug domain-containing protein, partial [Bacteroidales bacterium]|nr:TonB-dependent receptor plug domain-containing protein [Bacteroidales bacterium]
MKKLLFLLISVCSLSLSFTAEAKVVRGQVVDASNGEPLIGATITPKGGGHATATDLDGRFSIDVPNNVKDITVTYIGMVTRVVEAADNLLITMETAENTLDDVVVTAYGTSTKGAFTGSAGVVDAATIEKRQVSNLTQALSGTVAGVQIQSYNGQPGTSASVKVRGIGSLNAGTAPLYIVDGIPYDGDMSAINTADIESMTVLKDAASTALYGARGANGIIMITTKKGRSASNGKAVVTFDARWGANSRQIKNYDVLT